MRTNKAFNTFCLAGIIAGIFVFILPALQKSIVSKELIFLCLFGGGVLIIMSLALLSKKLRPETVRKLRIDEKDERTTSVRDKAGARTLTVLLFAILISQILYYWFDVPVDYMQVIWYILIAASLVYFGYTWYYQQKL